MKRNQPDYLVKPRLTFERGETSKLVVFRMTRNDNGVFRMFSEGFHITFAMSSQYSHIVKRIIDHLPDDKKKSTKAEEEDESKYGSDQHQCA